MPDVNFLPIRGARFRHRAPSADNVLDVHFAQRQMTDFPNSTIGRAGRAAFERKQLEDNWAQTESRPSVLLNTGSHCG